MESVESIENRLQELINENNLGQTLTIDMIKDLVWSEVGDRSFDKFIRKSLGYFNDTKNINKLNTILQIFNDAWNYFPHKCLDGKSPAQVTGRDKK